MIQDISATRFLMTALPLDIYLVVFQYLNFDDLIRLSQVNRELRNLLLHASNWRGSPLVLGVNQITSGKQGYRVCEASVTHWSSYIGQVKSLTLGPAHCMDTHRLYLLMSHLHQLNTIDLSYTQEVDDEVIHSLVRNCPMIQKVRVVKCRRLTSLSLFSLARCPHLTHLDISHTACATDRSMSLLLGKTQLVYLGLTCAMFLHWDLVACLLPHSIKELVLDHNPLLTAEHLKIIVDQTRMPLVLHVNHCEQLTGQEVESLKRPHVTIYSNALLWDHSAEGVREYIQKYLLAQ